MTNEDVIRILREYQYGGGDGMSRFGPHSFDLTSEIVEHIISALERDRWISVNQMLPKKGQVVLAQGLRSCTTGQFQGITTAPRYWWWKGHTIKEVTHWRELPEPPKEET